MTNKPDIQYIQFYTAGSAAQKIAPVVPLKTLRMPKVRKHKKITLFIDPVATAAIAMCAVVLIMMFVGLGQLNTIRQKNAVMAAHVQTLQSEKAALEAAYEAGYDLEEVERTALASGMIPKDQAQRIAITVPSVEQEATTGPWEQFCTFLAGLFA